MPNLVKKWKIKFLMRSWEEEKEDDLLVLYFTDKFEL